MTRAETLAEIKREYGPADDLFCDCERVPSCQSCTVLWLLQDNDYLNAQIAVSRDGRAVLAAELEYIRMAGIQK